MNSFLTSLYYHITNDSIRRFVDFRRRKRWYEYYILLRDYYKHTTLSREQKECLSFLKHHRLNLDAHRCMYMSDIVREYSERYKDIVVHHDSISGIPYVFHDGKALFFKKSLDDESIKSIYSQFLSEMDVRSPHVYCTNPNELNGRVLFDCGVAEGLFPLTYVDRFEKIFLFECDDEWLEALTQTFSPYKDKVTIVKSLVSEKSEGISISLDDYARNNGITPSFLKMDIEGFEESALLGAKQILKTNDIICSICTYHKPTSENDIISYLKSFGFRPQFNSGFMFFHCELPLTPPYLRRGVVRFYKGNVN